MRVSWGQGWGTLGSASGPAEGLSPWALLVPPLPHLCSPVAWPEFGGSQEQAPGPGRRTGHQSGGERRGPRCPVSQGGAPSASDLVGKLCLREPRLIPAQGRAAWGVPCSQLGSGVASSALTLRHCWQRALRKGSWRWRVAGVLGGRPGRRRVQTPGLCFPGGERLRAGPPLPPASRAALPALTLPSLSLTVGWG